MSGPLNAFIAGAQSVNPGVTGSATFIESWFDPAKAKESTIAQIAAGSDMIYMERFGPLEAILDADNVYGFGHMSDQIALDPDRVLCSSVMKWDPAIEAVIDAWWGYTVDGVAYDAPMERIMYFMPDNGSDIGTLSDSVPDDVEAAVLDARDKILSGELVVEFNDAPPGG